MAELAVVRNLILVWILLKFQVLECRKCTGHYSLQVAQTQPS